MGTWGAGTFEDDGALDYLGGVIDSLVERIEEILADEEWSMLDEEGEAVLVPSVHIISVLVEHCGGALPKAAQVLKWRKKYLKIFNEEIGGLAPKGATRQHDVKSSRTRSPRLMHKPASFGRSETPMQLGEIVGHAAATVKHPSLPAGGCRSCSC